MAALVLPRGSFGGGRRFGASRRRNFRSSRRRTLIWDGNIFSAFTLTNTGGTPVTTELELLSNTELLALTDKATIGMIYGRMVIRAGSVDTQAPFGAWGICLKDADSPTGPTAFSPGDDAESSIWMTWRGFALVGSPDVSDPQRTQDETFVIRNPRKIQPNEELVANVYLSGPGEGSVQITFWARVGILLP